MAAAEAAQHNAIASHLADMMVASSPTPEKTAKLLETVGTMRVEPDTGDGPVTVWFAATRFMVTAASFVPGAPIEAVETMDLIFSDNPDDVR